jgi:hypothetical protein
MGMSSALQPTAMDQAMQDPSFGARFDMLPVDMSSRATPDSTNPTASPQPGYPANPVRELGDIMFPSEDPFAYPNQPMMELGFQPSMTNQSPGPAFMFPGPMEDIENQFFGHPPPYMMGPQNPQTQPFMNFSQTMFDPVSYGGMQSQATMHPHQMTPQRQHSTPGQTLQRMQQQRRGQPARRQQESRQIEQIFEEQGMQADWGSFFGSGRGVFQGL